MGLMIALYMLMVNLKYGLSSLLNDSLIKEQWFPQFFDHAIHPIDRDTTAHRWKQRYFTNSQYYKEGGPVFLMLGGEGPADPEWIRKGHIIELAKDHGALCFLLEHRFYGESHPLPDTSTKNLEHLNIHQALADVVFFIEEIHNILKLPQKTKWITYGCSYAGTLAAWMRMKYPHFVYGAISISAPLLAKINFQVEKGLKTHSEECVNTLATAMKEMQVMLRNVKGQAKLKKLFNLCDPINSETTNKDMKQLYKIISDIFAEVVQNNLVNSKKSSISINTVCDVLINKQKGVPVKRLAEVSNIILNKNNKNCLDYKYSKSILNLRNTTFSRPKVGVEFRQWRFQCCTEVGFFPTLTAQTIFFNEALNIDFFFQRCVDIFGEKFLSTTFPGVKRTNIAYGGLDIVNHVTNVVFVHGSMDPWQALGIVKSYSPKAHVIYINGTAHCATFYPESPKDTLQLTQARKQISALVTKWLRKK